MLPALLSGALLGALNLGHCATMCGPWLAASCAQRKAKSLWSYQLGRTASYSFAGALGGHFGAGLSLTSANPWTAALFALAAAVGCVWSARLLWPASGLVQVQLREPRRARTVFATLLSLVPQDVHVLGLLSVFLPCGLLALALLGAVASGNPTSGAAFMLGFVSASGVALLGSGFALKQLPRAPARLRKLASFVLVGIAALLLLRPLAAFGSSAPAAPTSSMHCH